MYLIAILNIHLRYAILIMSYVVYACNKEVKYYSSSSSIFLNAPFVRILYRKQKS